MACDVRFSRRPDQASYLSKPLLLPALTARLSALLEPERSPALPWPAIPAD